MADTEKLIMDNSMKGPRCESGKKDEKKVPWYLATGLMLFWVVLFFAVVIPFFYRLPKAMTIEDDDKNVFIAERAYKDLYTLSKIGTKMVGSKENEVDAVNFLLKQLNQIKDDSLKEFFDIEIDLSQASGQFTYSNLVLLYQGVQNIAVKITPKNCTSQNYLLVNSHFDSKPYTPSAGDAGSMIVVMLEVLRVIATTRQTFEHPIVFLFNGAEEIYLLASHGFMNQHKWAPHLKAFVNLDSGGTNSRDVLVQTGPKNGWLLNYYKKYVKHPFATILASEIFDTGYIPSDTDFTIFKEYMPGFGMAQLVNGYTYHTKYDRIELISHEAIQNTGDNVLGLVRGLSNATELRDPQAYDNGNSVYFDFLGVYFIHYSEATGDLLNFGVAGTSLLLVLISVWRMATISHVSICHVIVRFILVIMIQIIAIILAVFFPIAISYVMDLAGLSLTYYSTPMLIIGLYICPALIGLMLPIIMYYSLQRYHKISSAYHLQLALHSQAIILTLIVIALTVMGIRSTYIVVIPLLFYAASLALNLLTPLHDRGYAWTALLKLGQIIPMLSTSYVIYLFVVTLTPMGARAGSASNRDLFVAGLAAIGTILCFGFLVPLISTFRRPSLVIFAMLTCTVVSVILASSTQLGFPFRPKTSGQRVAYLHARNRFYEYDGTLSKDESGYLFLYQDRRKETILAGSDVNLDGLVSLKPRCEKHMMCGMPLYDYRYVSQRLESKWLPRSIPVVPPGSTQLELLGKTKLNSTHCRYEFNLTGPAQMGIFLQTYEDAEITNWSFLMSYLNNPPPHPLSFHIYINYGIDSSPLNFFVDLKKTNGDFNVPLFQLGVSGHYIGYKNDMQSEKFASTFPSYAILADWPSSYDRYIF